MHALEVLVEVLDLGVLLVELGVVVVGLGDEEHHRRLDVELRLDEELGDTVQVGRVRSGGVADRKELVLVVAPHGVLQALLAAHHQVEVALERAC